MVYIVLLYRNGLEHNGKALFRDYFLVPWVYSSTRHDTHQFGNGQCLGLYQGTSIGNIRAELAKKQIGINLCEQIYRQQIRMTRTVLQLAYRLLRWSPPFS